MSRYHNPYEEILIFSFVHYTTYIEPCLPDNYSCLPGAVGQVLKNTTKTWNWGVGQMLCYATVLLQEGGPQTGGVGWTAGQSYWQRQKRLR